MKLLFAGHPVIMWSVPTRRMLHGITEKKENTILLQEISNVKLLMYIYTNSEGKGVLGDFFDHRIDIRYQVNASKTIKASPFSYLQNEENVVLYTMK